jgi:UDP-glucuronate decarboxylase
MSQKTKILITGVAGNIGSALACTLLKDEKYLITGVDNFLTGNKDNLPINKNFKFVNTDVNIHNDISPIILHGNFDYIFHFAAVVGVLRTLDNPLLVFSDIDGIKNILQLSKSTSVKRVFFSSSSEVYGEPVSIPQNEATTPLNSKLPYAIVKNIGEAYFRSYFQIYNLEYTIFRFFNTYGPNQSTDFVIPKLLELALDNLDIKIYGNGSQTRTFCYIQDNIDTIVNCLEKNLFVNDVLNIGSDTEITILELAKLIIKKTNSKSQIIFIPALKEGDMTRRQPDIDKMKSVILRDLVTLELGIDYLLSNKK